MAEQLVIATTTICTTKREETCTFCAQAIPKNTRAIINFGNGWMHFECMLEAVEKEGEEK